MRKRESRRRRRWNRQGQGGNKSRKMRRRKQRARLMGRQALPTQQWQPAVYTGMCIRQASAHTTCLGRPQTHTASPQSSMRPRYQPSNTTATGCPQLALLLRQLRQLLVPTAAAAAAAAAATPICSHSNLMLEGTERKRRLDQLTLQLCRSLIRLHHLVLSPKQHILKRVYLSLRIWLQRRGLASRHQHAHLS